MTSGERVILRRRLARGGAFAAAIASLILLLPLSASALTFHWIGGATGNWNDAAEWDTIDAGGSEAAWPSTTGDIAIFPAALVGTTTVTIPNGVNAVFGELRILTNSTVTIQHGGTGPAQGANGGLDVSFGFSASFCSSRRSAARHSGGRWRFSGLRNHSPSDRRSTATSRRAVRLAGTHLSVSHTDGCEWRGRFAADDGMDRSEQGVSLEEVLRTTGLSRVLPGQFTKAFREQNQSRGLQDRLAGIGPKYESPQPALKQ